ncbi:cache domain-containing protein [Sedimentitalea sp. HM32M-2]|uniref:cache domain-containing protein n=1 Tax=Sedimentitalea sp. HM32M-2 TaxID=3351566 RepID=UPI00364540AC
MRKILVAGALAIAATGAVADEFGTAEEAQAMVEAATNALTANEEAALAAFNSGEAPFRAKDLYVFCGDADGNFSAHGANPDLVGKSLRGLEDKAGNKLGESIYTTAVAGEYHSVEYQWPRPGETEVSEKESILTKVDDQICGVGYYK